MFYTDGTSQVINVTADSRNWLQGQNGDTGTQYVTVTAPSGKTIQSLVIGAGDTESQFSLDSTISVKWDIDDATVTSPLDEDSLTLNFGATVTDGTGNSANTDFSVIIEQDQNLQGTNGNDALMGSSQADTLIGGEGDDILFGGSGADTFIWQAGDLGNDVIKDFNASEGDRIDLRDLLQGESDSNILNYLRVNTSDSTLEISTTGQFNAGGSADVTIKLENGDIPVDLSSYGSTSSAIVNSLIAGGDLALIKVDHT